MQTSIHGIKGLLKGGGGSSMSEKSPGPAVTIDSIDRFAMMSQSAKVPGTRVNLGGEGLLYRLLSQPYHAFFDDPIIHTYIPHIPYQTFSQTPQCPLSHTSHHPSHTHPFPIVHLFLAH